MSASPFAALGLPDDATANQVRAAWRIAAWRVHPDGGGDVEAFTAMRAAFERALKLAENRPCTACEGKGQIMRGRTQFSRTVLRCLACDGTGMRKQ